MPSNTMVAKNDWVIREGFDIPAQVISDPYEVSLSTLARNHRTELLLIVDLSNGKQASVKSLRLATNEDFIIAVNKLKIEIAVINRKIEDVNADFNQFLKSSNPALV